MINFGFEHIAAQTPLLRLAFYKLDTGGCWCLNRVSSGRKFAGLFIDSKGMDRITLLVFGQQKVPFWRETKIAWRLAI